MLKLNKTQNEIIDRRNQTIQVLEDRLKEEKEYLAAFIKTIPLSILKKMEDGDRK